MQASLKYLQVDYVDIYLLHWPDSQIPIADTMGEIIRMKEAGYFRHFGVSNFNDKQIEQIEQFLPVEVFQPQYSMLVRQQKPLIDFAAEKNIGVMSYGPLAGGMLAGKFKKLPTFEGKVTRNDFYPFFREPVWCQTRVLVDEL